MGYVFTEDFYFFIVIYLSVCSDLSDEELEVQPSRVKILDQSCLFINYMQLINVACCVYLPLGYVVLQCANIDEKKMLRIS